MYNIYIHIYTHTHTYIYVYAMEYHSAMKKNEIMPLVANGWM